MDGKMKRTEEEYEKKEANKDEGDKEEKERICRLRAIVEKFDPEAFKDAGDGTLRRFLCARDLDVEKAFEMLVKFIKWRQEFVPKGFISPLEIQNQIAHKKVFMQGTDKRGCPIGIGFGVKHFPSKEGTNELKRYAVFVLDKLCSRIPKGEDKFIIIADLQGYGYSNIDVGGYIDVFSILQDYYPERLRKFYFVNAPYIFTSVWKIIHLFIDKNTKKKIEFVEKKRIEATLTEEIDRRQLPVIYGGPLELVPIEDS